MARKYLYYPAYDGKKASPVMQRLIHLMGRRWGFKSLGIYANRPVRNPLAKGALSTHATGWALDAGYKKADRDKAEEAFTWLVQHSEALRLSELHDYAFGKYGRGYRCSRGAGAKGVKLFTAKDNAGSIGGLWLHAEIDNTWEKEHGAGAADAFEAAWRALPKPNA
jgi:hypothetical protein